MQQNKQNFLEFGEKLQVFQFFGILYYFFVYLMFQWTNFSSDSYLET